MPLLLFDSVKNALEFLVINMKSEVRNVERNIFSPIKNANRLIKKDIVIKSPRNKVLFILLENFSMSSFSCAVDVLVTSNLMTHDPVFEISTCSVGGSKVVSDVGIEVSVTNTIDQFQNEDINIVVVCGGFRTALEEKPCIQKIVRRSLKNDGWVGGLWNGAYFLAAHGIYDRHECAIHPDSRNIMKERYPNTRIARTSYVMDGQYFSCAGPHSSILVMLDLVEKIHGSDMRRAVNGILLGVTNGSVNSATSNGVRFLPSKLETIIELMENNLEEPLDISDLSSFTSLSRRQVERLFSRYLDTSPSRYYLELRLDKGRQLLLKTKYSIGEIAIACGFSSQTHFSHSFKAVFGASPTSIRLDRKEIF